MMILSFRIEYVLGSQPTQGNIAGGLSTIEEKALGNIEKTGSRPVISVLKPAEAPRNGPGLYFMDTSSAAAECVTLMAAAGAVVHFFPAGQGNIIGNPIEPVIKITANPKTARAMSEHIDVDVSGYAIVPVAAAPVLGHAFSPFLKGRGGKAIAVTFGVWSAATEFSASLAYAVILAVLLAAARWINKGRPTSAEADGFQVVFGMLLLSVYLAASGYSCAILGLWLVNSLLLVYTHRRELRRFFGRLPASRGRL
ncbi:hypothetical protein GCM10027018_14700 [Paenibacillus thermoaerophilus]